ncbi:hypothetical protein [Shinella sp.]|uniref:hypothetical protein n=1 Tax=Shinella sp. TaxID=1870904 RepID=UPI003F71A92E
MATATQLLPCAKALDTNVVLRDDLAFTPDTAFAGRIGEVVRKTGVFRQLRLDRLDQERGLRVDIADLQNVTLLAKADAVERKAEGKVRGL